MTEADAIEQTDEPLTVERLVSDLRDLGVESGDTLLVHSSLSSLGWVAVGPPTVVDALMEAVGEDGTLVMPTHSTQYSDPSDWQNPPVPSDWIPEIRSSAPPYRPDVTPTRGMGAIAECFRAYPSVVRSRHPLYSFAAWGDDAEAVVADHGYDNGLGEESPLARVYERDGEILMLGTGHDTNTSLHLAEHRGEYDQTFVTGGAPVMVDDDRQWISFEGLDYDSEDFADAGDAFERDRDDAVVRGEVGCAETRLLSQRELVDYGAEWFGENRT
ncbi:aminoglycoside N(3)-acetyltransferase [Halorussus halophilus]|uniref:aminoglycoside N(3)-acetyltransferase n=1 Tax=Halorussus halophilus TaxID=2650975 RepID=UPI0013014985|nr:AAC(3) family N-acetyltransferase [Halorussus halophilus]